MRKFILLFAALILVNVAFAQSDEDKITSAVNDFLEGGTNGEVDRFRSAFMKDAIQKAIGSRGVTGMTVESLASRITPNQKMDRSTRILSISYANNAATAITETDYNTSKVIDMLNLLKVDDDWKIVSRVYTRLNPDEDLQTTGASKNAVATPRPTKTPAPAPKKKVADDGW